MIRLLKKAMQLVCLALMLVVLMAVVSVADGDMPLLNGVILFISCLLGVCEMAGRQAGPGHQPQRTDPPYDGERCKARCYPQPCLHRAAQRQCGYRCQRACGAGRPDGYRAAGW